MAKAKSKQAKNWDQFSTTGLSTSLCLIFMILVSLENVIKCVLDGCTITLLGRSVQKFFKEH